MSDVFVVTIRATITFFALLIFTRLIGKTQISQLSFFDYIVRTTIGSTASAMAINTNITMTSAAMGILTEQLQETFKYSQTFTGTNA